MMPWRGAGAEVGSVAEVPASPRRSPAGSGRIPTTGRRLVKGWTTALAAPRGRALPAWGSRAQGRRAVCMAS